MIKDKIPIELNVICCSNIVQVHLCLLSKYIDKVG